MICDPAMDDGLLQVDCGLLDEHNQPWVNTCPEIHVEVKGLAALVGLDHGDLMREVEPHSDHCCVKAVEPDCPHSAHGQ
ncbi:MAG: hypothetical protein IJZ74_04930 [Clostridia bacterium]|nr:hypothetical protein [Clostridia bacterium]